MRKHGGKVGGRLRAAYRLLTVCAVLAVTLVAWEMLALHGERVQAVAEQEATTGWGDEALARVDHVWPSSIIPPANACGLGTSSCFQCHNGFRASAPAGKPWHTQHGGVNNSCIGCHKGNARIMREDLAHKNMIVDSRTQPSEACAACHKDEDVKALVNKYLPGK